LGVGVSVGGMGDAQNKFTPPIIKKKIRILHRSFMLAIQ